jgi:tripartite-type tricarboxylate transporter receptor subunit TctC
MISIGRCFALLAALVIAIPSTVAQPNYPSRVVQIVVPQPTGGANDLPARLIAAKLQEKYGQPVIVQNKPGAGGNIGSQAVATSKPDGYTLLLNGSGMVFNAALANSPFKLPEGMSVIAKIADFPSVVAISANVPAKTVDEFVKWAGKNQATFGSAGVGSGGHIFGSSFMKETGVTMTHVPYIGGPAAVNGMLAGDIALFIAPVALVKPFIQAGKLRALAVTSQNRIPDFASVPTMAEAGYPRFVANQWFGVFGPAGMPDSIVNKLSQDIGEVVASPEVKQQLAGAGIFVDVVASQAFSKQIEQEIAYWSRVVVEAGIRKD